MRLDKKIMRFEKTPVNKTKGKKRGEKRKVSQKPSFQQRVKGYVQRVRKTLNRH